MFACLPTISKYAAEMGCSMFEKYPTAMDGVSDWSCRVRSGCVGGKEIVDCTGAYGHNYPFAGQQPPYIDGFRIMWDFMRSHRKND